MFVPEPPVLAQLECITPSIYEASVNCLAKAAWFALGDGGVLPQHPAAILGTAFHAVVAAAHKGDLQVESVSDRSPARDLFEKTAWELHQGAHPLVKLKFRSADRLPFYNLCRERATLTATPIAASRPPSSGSAVGAARSNSPAVRTESRLYSRDGRIVGRADHIDGISGIVVDYKTGHLSEAAEGTVSDSEARQLRLYAYLAGENGLSVVRGVVVRGDGRRCQLAISPVEAATEAGSAREQLGKLNAAVDEGASFRDLASPSAKICALCPCLPLCESFWAKAQPEWAANCGSNIEGDVANVESRQIQGVTLTTLVLSKRAGTISAQRISIEQIPTDWMRIDGLDLPHVGDGLRVVHGREMETEENAAVVRIDKVLTAVWRLRKNIADGS